jgi:hypothetical protein
VADAIVQGRAVQIIGADTDRGAAEVLLAGLVVHGLLLRSKRDELRRHLQSESHRFVADHWVAIERLAQRLLERREMTAAQVRRMFRRRARPPGCTRY